MQMKSQKEAILLFLQAAVREKLIRPGRYCDSNDAVRYHTFSLALSHSDARRARAHLLSLSLSLSLSHTHTHTVTHTQIHTNTSRAHSRAIPVALLAGLRSPSSQGMPSIRRTNVGAWVRGWVGKYDVCLSFRLRMFICVCACHVCVHDDRSLWCIGVSEPSLTVCTHKTKNKNTQRVGNILSARPRPLWNRQ